MRKKQKKFIRSSVIAFFSMFSMFCGVSVANNTQIVKAVELGNLENVQLSDGILTWNAFPGATRYSYVYGNGGGYLDEPTLDLETTAKSFHWETGEYSYSIYAVDEYGTKISEEIAGTYNYTNTLAPLETPTNLTWNHTIASWDEVEGADRYTILVYEYKNDDYVLITQQGLSTYGQQSTSKDLGKRFEVGKTYAFSVIANPAYEDLEHVGSAEAMSEHHSFEAVAPSLTNVTIENGQLSFDEIVGASEYEIMVSSGGGSFYSLPIDLYTLCSGIDLEDGTYDIKIKVYNNHNEPLVPEYVYEDWEYDHTLAPTPLTGTLTITGTLKVGETLTATLTDSNNTGTLTYDWYRSDPLEGWVILQSGPNNTFVITEPCANKMISVVVRSDVEILQVQSANTGVVAEADQAEVLNGTVIINGILKYGETLTASVTSNNTGTLSYQWKRSGVDIVGATSQTYTIVEEDIGSLLRVVVTSSVETGSIPSEATTPIAKADGPAAPVGITSTDCTNDANNDGTITGITTAMEYKLSSDSDWTVGTGETITGLTNGTYKVRIKETATHNAGDEATIIVNEYNAPAIPESLTATYTGTILAESTINPSGISITLTYSDDSTEPVSAGDVEYWYGGSQIQDPVNYVFGVELIGNLNITIKYEGLETTMAVTVVGHAITFNANTGTGSMEADEYVGAYTLPSNEFTAPTGKQFKGWSLTSNGEVLQGATYNVTEPVEFFAIWEELPATPESLTATYTGTILAGTIINPSGISITLTYSDDSNEPVDAGDVEYWYGGSEITNPIAYVFGVELIGNLNITIKYEGLETTMAVTVVGHAITFNANTGTGTMEATEYVGAYTLPSNEFTAPTGKQFKGWATSSNGSVIEEATYNVTAPVEFFAIWEDIPVVTYTVTFNANGGTGTMTEVSNIAGNYTLPANGFTAPEGKHFKGWATSATGNVIEGTTYNVTSDTTLYAIWEENSSAGPATPEQPENNNPTAEPESKGLGAGAIVGIVMASLVVLGTGGFAVVWFIVKKKTWSDFIAIFKKK